MWHKRSDRPLPALHDEDRIKLILKFPQYFGHFVPIGSYAVWAVWDGLNEEFFDIESKHYICDEDIAEWWEDNKNE